MPKTELAVSQRLTKRTRVLCPCNALVHVVQDFSLYLAVEFFEVGERTFVVFNRPGQARSGLVRLCRSCRAFQDALLPGTGLRGLRGFLRLVCSRKTSLSYQSPWRAGTNAFQFRASIGRRAYSTLLCHTDTTCKICHTNVSVKFLCALLHFARFILAFHSEELSA